MTATYADIHPTGGILSMVLGHFIPMDAATTPEKDTLNRMIASRFRRPLTATGALCNPWHGCSVCASVIGGEGDTRGTRTRGGTWTEHSERAEVKG
jgi:hypothetical protein